MNRFALPRLNAAVALLAALCACTGVTEVREFTGETALVIECGPSIERCEARARQACPRGYDVLAAGENRTAVSSGTPGDRRSLAVADQVMKVKCR